MYLCFLYFILYKLLLVKEIPSFTTLQYIYIYIYRERERERESSGTFFIWLLLGLLTPVTGGLSTYDQEPLAIGRRGGGI